MIGALASRLAPPRPQVRATAATEVPAWVTWPLAAGVALLPLLRPSGPANSSPVDIPIAASLAAVAAWALAGQVRVRVPYATPVAVLMLGGGIATLVSPLADTLSGGIALVQDAFLCAWCVAMVNAMRTPRSMAIILRAWSWSAIAWAALLAGLYLSGHGALAGVSETNGARADLTFGNPNLAASYFFISIAVVAATRTPRRLPVRLGAYAVLLVALLLTGSNGGMLSLAVAAGVTFAVFATRRFGPVPVLAGTCAAVPLAVLALHFVSPTDVRLWAAGSGQPLLRDSIGRSDSSADQRRLLIEESVSLYYQGAPWGIGPAATKPALTNELAPYAKEAHDDYVAALVERGVIGAMGLLLLIAAVAARSGPLLRARLNAGFATLVPATAPLVGAAVGVAVSATYYQVLHFRQVWALLALNGALFLWGRR